MNVSIGLSLIAFPTADELTKFLSGELLLSGLDPVFELSYEMNREYLQAAAELPVRVMSVHAPCPHTEVLPNLGSGCTKVLEESYHIIAESARTAASFGAEVLVLHAGYATDKRIYTDFERRREVLEAENRDHGYVLRKEGMICGPAYCESDIYRRHLDQIVINLPRAAAICRDSGVVLAVENINPRITYLLQRPEDLLYLSQKVSEVNFCLDFGHLWLSSIVHGFDFLKAVGRIIGTGKVITTHIHNNHSSPNDLASLSDDHNGLSRGNIPLSRVLQILSRGNVERWIVEAKEEALENLIFLDQCRESLS